MIKLDAVIKNLNNKDYDTVITRFQKNKAEKFIGLLTLFRNGTPTDDEIAEKFQMKRSAVHTLKSRLAEKIQEHLYKNVEDPRIDLLRNVANIHNLLYNTARQTAIAMLIKLEQELQENDMPNALTAVYSALKKLHLHTAKYYEYSQQYNKHIAFTIALDKAEDLLSNFTKAIGEYQLTRDKAIAQRLALIKKEMQNTSRLYRSHHLAVYTSIVNISFALFVPLPDEIKDDEPVEEMLKGAFAIFDTYDKDPGYKYLRNVFDFLAFEYYHGLKLYKNEAPYFDKVNNSLSSFLLSGHCVFSTHFLRTKIERYIHLGLEDQLAKEQEAMTYEADAVDVPNYINLNISRAVSAYYSGDYSGHPGYLMTRLAL